MLKNIKKEWSMYFMALVFALCSVLGYTVDKDIFWADFFKRDYILNMIFIAGVMFLCFLIILTLILKCMSWEYGGGYKSLLCFEKHAFKYSLFIICICWTPIIVIFSPGSLINDAGIQIEQFLGMRRFTSHHPPFSSLILGMCYYLGYVSGNSNFGFLIYTLLQSVSMAIAFALTVKFCIRNWNVIFGMLVLGFFAIFPVWVSFAQAILKDGLFVAAVVFFFLFLVEFLQCGGIGKKEYIGLAIFGILTSLLRNNGIYIIMGVLFAGIFFLKGKLRKKTVCLMIGIVGLMWIYSSIVLPALGIMPGSKAEMLSLPFQQTALYVKEHGAEVTEEEKAVIDATLDYDVLAEGYKKWISDPVKGTMKPGADLKEYFKVWAKQLIKHPETYIQAFLNSSAAYYSISTNNAYFWNYFYSDSPGFVEHSYMISSLEPVRNFILNFASKTQKIPIVRWGYQAGIYTWLSIIMAWIIIRKRKYTALVILAPIFISILVCIASPVANCVRYMLPVMAVLPIAISYIRSMCYAKAE